MELKLSLYESFTIKTQDSVDVVRQRLLAQVKDPNQIDCSQECLFKGEVSEHDFTIFSSTEYISIINGKLEDTSNETIINVKMRLIYWRYISFVGYLIILLINLERLLELILDHQQIMFPDMQSLTISVFLCILFVWDWYRYGNALNVLKTKLTKVILGQT
jgi:hypothetical protein